MQENDIAIGKNQSNSERFLYLNVHPKDSKSNISPIINYDKIYDKSEM